MAHSHAHDAHAGHDAHHEHGATVATYMWVFGALCVFTLVSFVVNSMTRSEPPMMSATTGFAIILGVACIKAILVCAIFMHLKWDWSKLYFLIIPTFVLAPFLIFALLPDIVFYWKNANKGDTPIPVSVKPH